MNTAAPTVRPRGGLITDCENAEKKLLAPPCSGKALKRGAPAHTNHLIFLLCRNHLILIRTLSGAMPPPLWHPQIAIVLYYLYAIVEKFPV
jgi:hypothetical protein